MHRYSCSVDNWPERGVRSLYYRLTSTDIYSAVSLIVERLLDEEGPYICKHLKITQCDDRNAPPQRFLLKDNSVFICDESRRPVHGLMVRDYIPETGNCEDIW